MEVTRYAEGMQGKLIAAARSLLGLKQDELARLSGISHPTLRSIETDSGNPTRNSERKVVEYLTSQGIQFEEAPGRVAVALVRKAIDDARDG